MIIDRRLVLGAAAAMAAAGQAHAATRSVGGGRAHNAALRALEAYATQHCADWGLPGLAICVVDRDGYAGFVRTGLADVDKRTPVSDDHLFQVGSITKMMTGLAAHSLMGEGKLSPDARLVDLLPDLPISGAEAVTVQHLLNHTSGIPTDPPLFPEGGLWSGYAPGSHWSYCNTGYDLLGKIIAAADGRALPDVLEARVLRPLGMNASTGAIRNADRARHAIGYEEAFRDRAQLRPGPMAQAPWIESDNAAGCVSSTTADMALFLGYLLRLAGGDGGPVLTEAMAHRFMTDTADAPGWSPGARYGNGVAHVAIDERRYLTHTGGMVSFSSALHVDPDAGVAAFASSNVSAYLNYRPRDVTLFACALLRALREGSPAPSPRPARATIANPQIYARRYTAADGGAFELRADGDQLRLLRNGRSSALQSENGRFFASADADFDVTGLVIDVENEAAVRAWAGEVEYAVNPAAGFKPLAPDALRVCAGRYDNDDKWAGSVPVYARDGKLWLFNTEALTPLGGDVYRLGDEDWSPERVQFDRPLNGRPQRMLVSGVPFIRRFS